MGGQDLGRTLVHVQERDDEDESARVGRLVQLELGLGSVVRVVGGAGALGLEQTHGI